MRVYCATWEARFGRQVATADAGKAGELKAGVGEAHGTDEAGNDGGGTGPHFWVLLRRERIGRLA